MANINMWVVTLPCGNVFLADTEPAARNIT